MHAPHHTQEIAKRRSLHHLDEAVKGRRHVRLLDHGAKVKTFSLVLSSFAFQKALHVFPIEKLLHHQAVNFAFKILEALRNDAGAVEAGHFFKQHVNR